MTKPRLATIYENMCSLEESEDMNRIKSAKYINLLKEAEKIMEKEYDGYALGGLIKERITLEDDLKVDGKLSAVKCNLGARIQVHICCRQFNLFGHREGWTFTSNYDEKGSKDHIHWVIGEDTICGISGIEYTSEPSWIYGDSGCLDCKKKLFERRVKEYLEEEPRVPKGVESSSSAYGLHFERYNGFFKMIHTDRKFIKKRKTGDYEEKRTKKVLTKVKDPGAGKMTLKEWKSRFP